MATKELANKNRCASVGSVTTAASPANSRQHSLSWRESPPVEAFVAERRTTATVEHKEELRATACGREHLTRRSQWENKSVVCFVNSAASETVQEGT